MADMNDPLPGAGVSFWTMAAALVGSLLSLRTLVESGPTARALAVIGAWSLSFFATPVAAEYWSLTVKAERAVALLIAFIGVNVLAGIGTFTAKFRADPTAAVDWLMSLWRGRK